MIVGNMMPKSVARNKLLINPDLYLGVCEGNSLKIRNFLNRKEFLNSNKMPANVIIFIKDLNKIEFKEDEEIIKLIFHAFKFSRNVFLVEELNEFQLEINKA